MPEIAFANNFDFSIFIHWFEFKYRFITINFKNKQSLMTLIYKVVNSIPPIVQQTMDELGWVEFDEHKHREDEWNILWKPTR